MSCFLYFASIIRKFIRNGPLQNIKINLSSIHLNAHNCKGAILEQGLCRVLKVIIIKERPMEFLDEFVQVRFISRVSGLTPQLFLTPK